MSRPLLTEIIKTTLLRSLSYVKIIEKSLNLILSIRLLA